MGHYQVSCGYEALHLLWRYKADLGVCSEFPGEGRTPAQLQVMPEGSAQEGDVLRRWLHAVTPGPRTVHNTLERMAKSGYRHRPRSSEVPISVRGNEGANEARGWRLRHLDRQRGRRVRRSDVRWETGLRAPGGVRDSERLNPRWRRSRPHLSPQAVRECQALAARDPQAERRKPAWSAQEQLHRSPWRHVRPLPQSVPGTNQAQLQRDPSWPLRHYRSGRGGGCRGAAEHLHSQRHGLVGVSAAPYMGPK